MRKIYLFLLLLAPISMAFGQSPDRCATDMGEGYLEWMEDFMSGAEYANMKTTGGMRYVPMQVHIVRKADGSGGISQQDVFQLICGLNARYDSVGFYFYFKNDIRFINNDVYYEHNFFQGNLMMGQNNVGGAFNMYFCKDAAGACGYYSPSGQAVAITTDNQCASSATLAHEAGHFFGLPHTFSGWEGGTTPSVNNQERVNGTNCATAGDRFCDTPPDYEWDRWQCSSPPTFTDPNGATFQPDGTFIMSYANDACVNRFSDDQKTYMENYLVGQRPSLDVTVTPDQMPITASVMTFPTSGQTGVSPNSTTFTWKRVAGAAKYHLLVSTQPQFANPVVDEYVTDTFYTFPGNLAPLTQHIVAVKPFNPFYTCAPYTPLMAFTTDTVMTIGITKPMLQTGLNLYPNPVGQGTSVMLQFENDVPSGFKMDVYDILGKEVHTHQVTEKAHGRQVIPLPMLEGGIYMVRVETDAAVYSKKLLIRE